MGCGAAEDEAVRRTADYIPTGRSGERESGRGRAAAGGLFTRVALLFEHFVTRRFAFFPGGVIAFEMPCLWTLSHSTLPSALQTPLLPFSFLFSPSRE